MKILKYTLFLLCIVLTWVDILQWSASFVHEDAYEIENFTYLQQPDDITCGPTSATMLLHRCGIDQPISTVEHLTQTQWVKYKGKPIGTTSPEYLPIALRTLGLSANLSWGTLDRLKYYVNQRRPPIVLVRSGEYLWHYVVVIGYTPTHIVIADPGDGDRHEMPVGDFMGSWDFYTDMEGNKCNQEPVQILRSLEVYPRTMIVPGINIDGDLALQEVFMIWLICWLFFGLIVGLIVKALHPGEDPVGFFPTLGIGVAGSFIGGGIRWLLNMGGPFHPAGLLWSILGGVIFCWAYRYYRLNRFFQAQGRMPLFKPFKK